MPLSGTFDTMQLPDVFQWIVNAEVTGTLTISIDAEDTYIYFEKGNLSGISSDNSLRFDFAQMLLMQGIVNEEQLQALLAQKSSSGSLRSRVLEQQLATPEALKRIEKQHAFDTVLDLFFQNEGSFHFSLASNRQSFLDNSAALPDQRLTESISTQGILMDGMRRLDEWSRIREVFPSNIVVVSAVGEEDDDPVWKTLKDIGQPVSVGDLCLRLGSSRFPVYERLYELYQRKRIVLDEMNPGQANFAELGSVEVLVDNARVLVEEEQYEEAREILGTALSLEPENHVARELLKQLRHSQLSYLYEQIPPHKTPILKVERSQLRTKPLSPREMYLASRLNGKWDVGTLVVATPLGELDTLRILRKLIHAEIVRLV